MRKIMRCFMVACIFFISSPIFISLAGTSPPFADLADEAPVLISMDFKDADLKDILKVFSIQSGMNFIASEAVQDRKMTLYMEKVPIEKAMDKIFKANNLSYDLDKEANIFIVKEWGNLGPELVTKVFYLKHASVTSSSIKEEMKDQIPGTATPTSCSATSGSGGNSESSSAGGSATGGKWKSEESSGLTETVKKLLSPSGTIVEDYRTNSLIVTDVPSRVQAIGQVIAYLDVPIPQVLIEVEMLDVKKTAVDIMGIKWPQTLASLSVSGMRTTSFPFVGNKGDQNKWVMTDDPAWKAPANSFGAGQTAQQVELANFRTSHFTPSVLSVLNANLAFDFLTSQSDTKFLARPKILTLSNETAEIKIATDEAIGLITTTSAVSGATSESAERMSTGITLRVTPQVNVDTGEITMFVVPIVSEASTGGTFGGVTFKDPEIRSTKSMVKMRDGETIVLGGLIRTKTDSTQTKVPGVSSIPILGALFRHKSNPGDTERELLVFITPHIIRDNPASNPNIALTSAKKILPLQREQSAMTPANRQQAINRYLNNIDQRAQ